MMIKFVAKCTVHVEEDCMFSSDTKGKKYTVKLHDRRCNDSCNQKLLLILFIPVIRENVKVQ